MKCDGADANGLEKSLVMSTRQLRSSLTFPNSPCPVALRGFLEIYFHIILFFGNFILCLFLCRRRRAGRGSSLWSSSRQ